MLTKEDKIRVARDMRELLAEKLGNVTSNRGEMLKRMYAVLGCDETEGSVLDYVVDSRDYITELEDALYLAVCLFNELVSGVAFDNSEALKELAKEGLKFHKGAYVVNEEVVLYGE